MSDNVYDYLTGKKMPTFASMNDVRIPLYIWLQQLANRRFEWEIDAPEIPNYTIEKGLWYYGCLVAFELAGNKFILPCAMYKGLNIYNEYVAVQPYGYNGQIFPVVQVKDEFDATGKILNKRNGVLIYNNEGQLPTYGLIRPYVERLRYIWQSLGIHEAMSRTIGMIYATDKASAAAVRTQLDALFDKWTPFAVVGDKKLTSVKNGGMLGDVQWNVQYAPESYWSDYGSTLAQIFTMLGVENSGQTSKKERVNIPETTQGDIPTQFSGEAYLALRQKACEEMKTVLGWDVSCEMKDVGVDYETAQDALMQQQGEDQNGFGADKAKPTK